MTDRTINLTPNPEILEVIAEVDLQIYHCLAELVDNCLDELKEAAAANPSLEPRVDISLPTSSTVSRESLVIVADNGRGMTVEQLGEALRAGSSGKQMLGTLGMFGMGFNIATTRLGSLTEVRTGREGDDEWVVATIDIRKMIESDSYDVPIRTDPKPAGDHGTTITVTNLKEDTVTKLSTTRAIRDVKTRLGRIYTYMLRSAQGGHSGADLMGGEDLSLYVNNAGVEPYLPCIWDPSRSVAYRGADVAAATKIDLQMSDAFACMACGKWHSYAHDKCANCGSKDIRKQERRIWGWIGVQRYADKNEFGFSFLRHGRCLVDNDHSLFEWETPEGNREKEYPIELGMGRIVGEIHLDHAKPQVRKTDFDRESVDWKHMVERVRGTAPIRPKHAQERGYPENTTILAQYFNAFRRNNPGVDLLIPGNGTSAIHDQAKRWAKEFRDGDPEFLTDARWFAAAVQHDKIKQGDTEPSDDAAEAEWLRKEGLADLADDRADITEVDASDDDPSHDAPAEKVRPETVEERFARYKRSAIPLPETDREVRLGNFKAVVRVSVTRGVELRDYEGRPSPYAIWSAGGETQLYVDADSVLIRDFGWAPLDTAFMCAASDLMDLAQHPGPAATVIRELLEQYPDRRIDTTAVRDRAESLMDTIRERAVEIIRESPVEYWESLSQVSRQSAENQAVAVARDIKWGQTVESGDFARYLDAGAILDLIANRPDLVMDGRLFRSTYADLGAEAQADQSARVVGLVTDLRRMISGPLTMKTVELRRYLLSGELLETEVVDP